MMNSDILRLKVGTRSQGWDHLGQNPNNCDAVHNVLFCRSALHITLTGGLLADPGVLVQQFEGFKVSFPLLPQVLLKISINFS